MKSFFKRINIVSIMVFLLGCNLPATPTPAGTPRCTPGQLTAPVLNAPAMWSTVDSLTPTLSWLPNDSGVSYPYDVCSPTGYRVRLSQGPEFDTELGGYEYRPFTRNWTPYTPLQPGKEYQWAVSALSSYSTDPGSEGPIGGSFYFFTGPMCEEGALRSVRLLEPNNGAVVSSSNPLLTWEYKDPCLPPGYRVDLSTDPTFADTSLSGGTGTPSTRWVPGTDLTDCTWYYWRIAPVTTGGILAEYSPTRSFLVDLTGSCIYPYPLPTLVTIPTGVLLEPLFTLDQNANCRIGPGVVFDPRRSYLKGDILKVKGINDARTWIMVWMPNEGENFCWVSLLTGKLNTDPNSIPEEQSPPTPVPTLPNPTKVPNNQPQYNSCSDYTSQSLCKQDPKGFGCYWGPNGSCIPNKP